ncbi:MAG: WD40 repeat domain-containing serine/threonine protein kinase [Sandaracinaceae bacterium]
MSSEPGWSGPPHDDPDERSMPTSDRYDWEDVLGQGGTSVVYSVYDTRLGREVALKRARRRDRSERVAWEAWVVAQLEHPSIIPIYDASRDDRDEAFFTMRLVRGESLHDGLLPERKPRLNSMVRAFHRVCEAMAYAHARGVVHRDIKPANIMLGEFGEVLIVDWGLAALTAQARIEPPTGSRIGTLEALEGRVGTPGFMSPEQRDASAPDPRADVYSLGRVLERIVTAASDERVPELTTVIARATSPAASARYPDAGPLRDELAAFLDGRRLATHEYTVRELGTRVLREFRIPLALVGVATVAVIAALGVGAFRERVQRNRAMRAEQMARAAQAESEQTLATVLESRAVQALNAGNDSDAYLYAAHALARRPSPTARGVVLATETRGAVRLRELPQPACRGRFVFSGAPTAPRLCLGSSSVTLFDDSQTRRWTAQGRPVDAMPLSSGRWLVLEPHQGRLFDAEGNLVETITGVHSPDRLLGTSEQWGVGFRTQVSTPGHRRHTICGERTTQTVALGPDRVAAVCEGGSLVLEALDQTARREIDLPFGNQWLPAYVAAFDATGTEMFLGGVGGEVARLSLATGRWSHLATLDGAPVVRLAVAEVGLVVQPERGDTQILDARDGTVRWTISRRYGASPQVVDGRLLLAGNGRTFEWTAAPESTPSVFRASAGLSSLWVDDDWIAAGAGDGSVTVWARSDGAVRARVEFPPVVKRLARVGDTLFAALANPTGMGAADVDSWAAVEPSRDGIPTRRIARLRDARGDELLVTLPYRRGMRVGPPSSATWSGDAMYVDVDAAPDGRTALLLEEPGRLWIAVPSTEPAPGACGGLLACEPLPGVDARTVAVALANDGRYAQASPTDVRLRTTSGRDTRVPVPEGPLDIAYSPDGRHLLVGTRGGAAVLLHANTGRRLATFVEANGRIGWVGFDEQGDAWTASWDGLARRYSLGALERDAESLVAEAEVRGGQTLAEALTQ